MHELEADMASWKPMLLARGHQAMQGTGTMVLLVSSHCPGNAGRQSRPRPGPRQRISAVRRLERAMDVTAAETQALLSGGHLYELMVAWCGDLSLPLAGAQAGRMPASPSSWSIKARSETAARPQELVAHYTAQRTRATPEVCQEVHASRIPWHTSLPGAQA